MSAPAAGVVLVVWRAVVVYRLVMAAVAIFLIVRWRHLYAEPSVAFAVAAAIAVVTIVVAVEGYSGRAHRVGFVVADLLFTVALTLLSLVAQRPAQYHGSMPTLTSVWAAGPVAEAGIVLGTVGGLTAALLQFGASVVVRQGYDGRTLQNGLLLLVVGGLAGYIASLAADVARQQEELARRVERDRLTRSIHDGVLQVLGLTHRRGLAVGGQWAELGAEAARQEVALRALISPDAAAVKAGEVDLCGQLRTRHAASAQVSGPQQPVFMPAARADELLDAVAAAVQNIERHAGAGASTWIFLEELDDAVMVTVRDDGIGMAAGRLPEAAAAGRLGVSQSIRGRVAALGGQVDIVSAPGQGTEVEMLVPKA